MAAITTNTTVETSTQLSKTPIQYEPTLSPSGEYLDDDLKKYSWREFEEFGVKCPCCKGSKKIHRNKYTFKNSHCKTKKHVEYIKKMNADLLQTSEDDEKINNETYEKRLKSMKIQVVKEHQNYLIEKQRCETLRSQLKDMITENEELSSEKKQTAQFIEELVASNKDNMKRLKQYEAMTKMMMKIEGYEVDNNEEH